MLRFCRATIAILALVWLAAAGTAAAQRAEGSFERTLTVTGPAVLDVRTGSGSITVQRGTAGRVVIKGTIRAGGNRWFSFGDARELVRRVEQDPPIRQNGNLIRVEQPDSESSRQWVSISYNIEVPEAAELQLRTGSGTVSAVGVRGPVQAHSGSGAVRVSEVEGDVNAHTGSGTITVDAARGSIEAGTGSGHITVRGARSRLRAETGSGGVEIEGRPGADWTVRSSSGGLTLTVPDDAKFDLSATTASGRIRSDHQITTTTFSRRSLEGTVGGGGPRVRLSTSSGGITIRRM